MSTHILFSGRSSADRRSARLSALGCATALTLSLSWLPTVASAADAANGIPEVIVTGKRTLLLDSKASIGKIDVPMGDIPKSIQVIPRELMDDQGSTRLTDVLSNVSGASQGGQFAFGFYDRAVLRGLNITYLTDGMPDAPSELGGIPHSLTGVERVEVLKGPGSALYGVTQQGGSINLAHYRPADKFGFNLSEQIGSYGATTTTIGVTGPTGIPDVDFRVDANYDRTDGWRGRLQEFAEFLPALSWRNGDHDVELRVEYRNIHTRPDASGIPFAPPAGSGEPAAVSAKNRYYAPFAKGNQEIIRVLASDAWALNDTLTLNNRLSFTHRTVDILRNGGGTVALLGTEYGVRSRQLRQQQDEVDDLLYQAELNAKVMTGTLQHNLLVGGQLNHADGHTTRSTADLPNIASLNHPVVVDNPASLTFLCNATHSCNDASLTARFYSVYAVDQIDVTEKFKVRLSARSDWFDTKGIATSAIPINPGMQRPCNAGETPPAGSRDCAWIVGVPVQRKDTKFSWDAGALYYITPELSAFVGAANANLPIFNTEEPQTVGGGPESGKQYEAGLRYGMGSRFAVSTSVYEVKRDAVFTVVLDPVTNTDVPAIFSYRTRGVEIDLNAEPAKGWNIVANFAHQNPKITSFPSTPANIGKFVPSVAPNIGNIWTSYDIPMTNNPGTLRLKAAMHYRQRAFADAGNTRVLPRSTMFDTGVAWIYRSLDISAGVNNLLDETNWLYGAGAGGGAAPGPGRTFFARLSYKM